MIDIHSHILPGVDDGARTVDEALNMLKIAVKDGVTTQVLTPHIHIGRFDNTLSSLIKQFNYFKVIVRDAGIPVELRLSAELRISPEIIPLVKNNQIPWLGHSQEYRYLLLEFPYREIPYGSENLVRWLLKEKVKPIIAHPERNRVFQQHPEKLRSFINLGCPIQLTASSLINRFGDKSQKLAIQLLKEKKIDIIATDCHNLKTRPPNLTVGVKEAGKYLGAAEANKLVMENPKQFILPGNNVDSLIG